MPRQNIVFSEPTTEEMWIEGGALWVDRFRAFPSKVIQAHVHELLFHAHPDPKRRRGPLDWVFYPCITHIPSWLTHTMDNTSCTIVAGSPNVVKAALHQGGRLLREGPGVEYLDPALTFTEPNLLKAAMFATWGPRLGITTDESDFAVDQGFAALDAFNARIERQGREILERVERQNKVAILMVGRPYHHDPGLNHGIPEEFQVRGLPDPVDAEPAQGSGVVVAAVSSARSNPRDIRDVWPENYSANSAQKVWAVRAAARHPNLAILDLSSFKCGHDAPTYGIIDGIVKTAKLPYAALHDLDANKPGGSIRIRVRTYVHKLKLVEEELADRAAARAELARRVADRRAELRAEIPRPALRGPRSAANRKVVHVPPVIFPLWSPDVRRAPLRFPKIRSS